MGLKRITKRALVEWLTSSQIQKEREHESYLVMKDITPDKREKLTEREEREVVKKWSGGGIDKFFLTSLKCLNTLTALTQDI